MRFFCFGLLALCGSALPLLSQNQPPLKCDSVAITCQGQSPTDYTLGIMDVSALGAAPTAAHWPPPAANARHQAGAQAFTRQNMGQLFGLTYDLNGNLFAAATSSYNTNNWGGLNNVSTANVPQNSGSIYRVTSTGVAEFAEIPNKGQGIGNICFDRFHNLLFASNFHDGRIYAINATTGATVFSFDPNFSGTQYGTPAPDFIHLGQRPWGVAAFGTANNNVILYYSRWSIDQGRTFPGVNNEIWSISINTAGTAVTGAESLVHSVPYLTANNRSSPVADIEISTDGLRMLLAERCMSSDDNPSAHASRVIELTRSNVSSTVWVPQPLNKFGVGASAGTNSSGGTDFGEYFITPINGRLKGCNASVWAMADYINFTAGNYVYGVQILNSTGGTVANSKWIDANNDIINVDKTELGDVDYRRCLDCPIQGNELCGFYRPDFIDTACCRVGLRRVGAGTGPTINSINYTVTGGVIQGFTSDCVINAPASHAGNTSGTITFSSPCTNMTFIWATLQATSATGLVTVTWTINFANGTQCVYVTSVRPCPHVVIRCDDFKFKQCICTGAGLNYIDVAVTNQLIPNSPICSLKIVKYDIFNNPQTTYWNAGIVLTPPATPFTAPFVNVPAAGSFTTPPPTGANVNAQLYFTGSSFSGSITVTAYHCNGDSCVRIWRPLVWPTDVIGVDVAELVNARPRFSRTFTTAFKLKQAPRLRGSVSGIKYASIGLIGQTSSEIIAITGSDLYPERSEPAAGRNLRILSAAHARQNALWELQDPLTFAPGDSSSVLHVVFANEVPRQASYALYDAEGGVLFRDTITISSSTVVVDVTDLVPDGGGDFFLAGGFPNPTKDAFNVRYVTGKSYDLSFSVFDLSGRMVEQVNIGMQPPGIRQQLFQTGHYPDGVYFIRMMSSDGRISEPLKMGILK